MSADLRRAKGTWLAQMRRLAVFGFAAIVVLIAVSNLALWWISRDLVVFNTDELAERLTGQDEANGSLVAIIPGAAVRPSGNPSLPLANRLEAGAELYSLGLVDHILVSGDNRTGHYDEPTVMRREAHLAGVPLVDISVDYAGFDTWDTCVRAKQIFAVDRAVFVTQERYGRRAASLCQAAGLEVSVLAIPNPPPRPRGVWLRTVGREPLAAVKGFYEVLFNPSPTFLGPVEGLEGSEQPANPDPVLGE